ncbi:hypothetical protein EKO04_008399 [Ascochyta lentis]|uniref:Uncharacterized protein n=1 Tax=Ascochyta lentis TaxID=205686 RepID=A0A8H7IZK2_9PLEO|nr:hypothetical protein EKO04_008399 [Ascochyta lentis]
MPAPTTPQETSPSRNFSYPARQRAATLSPQHDQDNPPMAPNDSRYFLPLPSAIFSRSTSNLHSESHLNADYGFSYHAPRRPETAHTVTSYSVPDLTLTALPQPPLPPLPNQGLQPMNIQPPSPRKIIKSPPRSPTKSTKGSGWRRVGRKIKRAFKFGRQRKRGSREVEGQDKVLSIGSPYNFQHVETHGLGPLRTGVPTSGDAMTGQAVVQSGDSDRGGGAQGSELGRLDVEGTAVEDDGMSEWEDYEGDTRIFFQQDTVRRRA